MNPKGAFQLFKVGGIRVLAHWSWIPFIILWWRFTAGQYRHQYWDLFQILAIFGIVLLHEFGHSLATRSVGGTSDEIVLWPFGGVSYCQPPPRPGAMLWAIVAGPLVNVVLIPVFLLAYLVAHIAGLNPHSDPFRCFVMIFIINAVMLVFNLLPIYPLDGGKILWSILWYFVGPGRSLIIAARLGMVLSVALAIGAYMYNSSHFWTILVCIFMFIEAYNGANLGALIRESELNPQDAITEG